MAYLNKIDINGRTYYLQHLTDGKNEAMLPTLTTNSKIIVQDANVYSGNIGDTNTPVYIKDNKVVAFSERIGNAYTPVYVDYGNIKPLSNSVGSATNPIYMNEGAITASNETVGSSIMPIYMQDGIITPSDSTVGSSVKPIYLNAGVVTVSDGNVGATNQPIYMSNGEITVCSDNVGSAGVPVYMANGVITACNTIPVASGGTGATTAEKALENFGLTATAAELNTLDGITATVTELNYVDGVTSSIQNQFDDHDGRIETMETFFKEADIDASKEFIDTLKEIQTYITDDKTGASNMALSINGNKAAIAVLNGDEFTAGSVMKAVADAKTVLEEEIAKKLDKTDAYVHPSHNGCASGLYKITVDEFGHVSSVVAVSKDDIVGLGVPAQDTTYEVAVATTETEGGVDGLLSAADKAKYDKYEATIADLAKQIEELQKLVEGYHPVTEPEPDETE